LRTEAVRIAGAQWAEPAVRAGPGVRAARSDILDAALIGYLPAPSEVARLAGIPATEELREVVRAQLFPERRARLLARLATPMGTSGFVCLPVFADELRPRGGSGLAADVAQAVGLAAGLGARCVSLAGMIPAHTAYGFDVLHALGSPGPTRITTGHAATAASVVKTAMAAMAGTGRDLSDSTVACVGLGSVGRTSVELLLTLGVGSPKRLVLCDVASRSRQVAQLAADLGARGHAVEVALCGSDAPLAAQAYGADLMIAATSAEWHVLDVDRLRPGTIVVDDSFPHCFDAGAATRRMERVGDVLVVGGGLLACGPAEHTSADGLAMLPQAERLLSHRLPDTIASCQLESLLQAGRPELPLVHGLVDVPLALAYWDALSVAGVEAAPLHLLQHVPTPEAIRAFSGRPASI
ncbi:MAG: non-ribosomal peptide synthetase, partial [Actinomycetota bacterium]|nr:non-ribosomal peptide synthetase [Actinomycetota bacterium]